MSNTRLPTQDWGPAFLVALRWARKNLPRITEAAIQDAEARLPAGTERQGDPTPPRTPEVSPPRHSPLQGIRPPRSGPPLEVPPPESGPPLEAQPGASTINAAKTRSTTRGHTACDYTTGPHTEGPLTTITTLDSAADLDAEATPPTTTVATRSHAGDLDTEALPPTTTSITCWRRRPT
ncbi:unnamed protein product [Merluccius merluccius]